MPAGILCFSLIKETLNTFLKGTLLTKTDFLKHKEMVGLTSLRRDSMPVFSQNDKVFRWDNPVSGA